MYAQANTYNIFQRLKRTAVQSQTTDLITPSPFSFSMTTALKAPRGGNHATKFEYELGYTFQKECFLSKNDIAKYLFIEKKTKLIGYLI